MSVGRKKEHKMKRYRFLTGLTLMLSFGCAQDANTANDSPAVTSASDGANTGTATPTTSSPPPGASPTASGTPHDPVSPAPSTPGTSPTSAPTATTPSSGSDGEGGAGGAFDDSEGSDDGGVGGTAGSAGSPAAGDAGETPSAGGTTAAGGAGGAGGDLDAGSSDTPTSFTPCPTNGDPCAVLPLGDSITEGFGSSGGGYRVELFRSAVQDGKNLTFVGSLTNGPDMVEGRPFPRNHQGHGGYTIDSDAGHSGISGQITDQAIAMYRPHIVLLMIGTNDLNGNVDVDRAPARLGNLMDDIIEAAPDTLLVVASVIPMINGNNSKVAPYNAAIVGLVEERVAQGSHVMFLDNHAAFTSDPNFQSSRMGDSLHPNNAGYAVLGRSFYDAISAVLPDGP